MPILINGHEISDAEMAAELPQHQDAPQPLKSATLALILRKVLQDEAERLGIAHSDEDTLLQSLLDSQVTIPAVTESECARYYQQHPQMFKVGELAEARHILFQVTADLNLPALRDKAQALLEILRDTPERFSELAKQNSNCPSSEVGGSLGQLSRGQCVAEFDRYLFAPDAVQTSPQLIETRFGLHIVQVDRQDLGQLLPFEQVQTRISESLQATATDKAWQHYLKHLVGQAQISGITLNELNEGLLQ